MPIVAAAMVCTARFVPESRAPRARRFDPVGQTLVVLVLTGIVSAIIESHRFGWTSPVILGLLAATALAVLGILGSWPSPAPVTGPRRAPTEQRHSSTNWTNPDRMSGRSFHRSTWLMV